MLDNFQYGGPGSQSNNNLFASPDGVRGTVTASHEPLYLNSSRAKSTFGRRDQSAAPSA